MIIIDPATLSEALRDLHERTLINLITGQVKWPDIIQAINDAGISDPVIAKRLGESRSTVHRWHSGRNHPRSFETACRVLMIYKSIPK